MSTFLLNSKNFTLEGWFEIRCLEFHDPEIGITVKLTINIGIGSHLINRLRPRGPQPGGAALGIADLGEDLQPLPAPQHAKDAAAIGVSLAQHGAWAAGNVAQPQRHGYPDAGLHARFHAP